MTAVEYYHLSLTPSVRVTPRPLQIIRVTEEVEAPRRAVRLLQEGGLLAYPTETLYGLGCDVFNIAAVRHVYEVKGRPLTEALPILIADRNQLSEVAGPLPDSATRLMDRFWPGALTLILPRGRRVPSIVSGGGETLGVRLPDHPIPVSLIGRAGVPIVGTSANVHGGPAPVTAQHVVFSLGDRVHMVLDGGRTRLARESTVVDVTQNPPRIVREGAIPTDQIEEVLR